jgi:hypothetical protein
LESVSGINRFGARPGCGIAAVVIRSDSKNLEELIERALSRSAGRLWTASGRLAGAQKMAITLGFWTAWTTWTAFSFFRKSN